MPPVLGPLRQSAFQPPGNHSPLSPCCDGLVGVDTVGAAAIGDNLGAEIERRRDVVKIGERGIPRAGNVTHRELIGWPDIEEGDGPFSQTLGQFGAGDGFGGIHSI